MNLHTPFHPFQRHPLSAYSVEIGNLLMILLGIALVLVFKPMVD
jgi:hypothetical protein